MNFAITATGVDVPADAIPDVECDYDSPHSFPIATTTVHCKATDFYTLVKTMSFDIIVVEPIVEPSVQTDESDSDVDIIDEFEEKPFFGTTEIGIIIVLIAAGAGGALVFLKKSRKEVVQVKDDFSFRDTDVDDLK